MQERTLKQLLICFAIFLLLTFAATASDNVQIGSGGNVWKNSPFAIAQTLMVMTVFAVFILTAFVANVVVRDDETGFGPIIHSTRLSRFDYLFGRFTGAFFAGCLLFLSAPLGMILGAAIVLTYTTFGGMLSVAILDFVQMGVIMGGMLYIGYIVSGLTGGAVKG